MEIYSAQLSLIKIWFGNLNHWLLFLWINSSIPYTTYRFFFRCLLLVFGVWIAINYICWRVIFGIRGAKQHGQTNKQSIYYNKIIFSIEFNLTKCQFVSKLTELRFILNHFFLLLLLFASSDPFHWLVSTSYGKRFS